MRASTLHALFSLLRPMHTPGTWSRRCNLIVTVLLGAIISAAATAEQINILWYTYAAPGSEYRAFYSALAGAPQVTGVDWRITFFGPTDPAPDFGRYNVLVIHSGEAWRTNPPGGSLATPDYSGILNNRAAIEAVRGERTFISAADADFHAIRGDSGQCIDAHCGAFDGALGYVVNAVNWAASGAGLGILSFFHGEFAGSLWWEDPASFLRAELLGNVVNFQPDENNAIIPAPATSYPLNQGLTTTGLSNWNNSFHGGFPDSLPGYAPTVVSGSHPGYAVSIATSAFVNGGISGPGTRITATPASVAPNDTINATWINIAAPTPTDWIGLFVPGAASTDYIDRMYVNCSDTPSQSVASGSCPFDMPNAAGKYELRLLANDGFTVLATSNAVTVTAVVHASVTTLSSAPNPSSVGDAVLFTASVTGVAPGGTVGFSADGNVINGCAAVALGGAGDTRNASCSTTALSTGSHGIVASYSGDAGNAASSSTPLTQTVNGPTLNAALQSNGGVASASTTYSTAFSAAGANNGDRRGAGWGSGGGGWADATANAYPDWLQVTFNGPKTINRIDVFTVQDNYQAPSEPTTAMTFSKYGITAFQVQTWNGAGWVTVPGGVVTGNNKVWRSFSFADVTTDRVRVLVDGALASYARITEVEAWTTGATATNRAPTVSLSAPLDGTHYTAPATITLTADAADTDGTVSSVELLNGTTVLARFTAAPYTFTWSNVPAGNYAFTARATDNAGAATTSPAVNVTVDPAASTNVALRSNGGVASASSTYSAAFAVAGVNNGDRRGIGWGAGSGGWADATANIYPDWLQVTFNGAKTINRIDVFTVQDNYQTPSDPTPSMTFSKYGITAFEVQTWNGVGWVTVPGGAVSGNNKVWRSFNFGDITTDRVRVLIGGALASYARITELEAWSVP